MIIKQGGDQMSETENKQTDNESVKTNQSILDEEFPPEEELEEVGKEKKHLKKTNSGRKTDCYVGYNWPPGC